MEDEEEGVVVVRGDRERCWTGLRCLPLICIFYDASSCQNTRSHDAVPPAQLLLLYVSFSSLSPCLRAHRCTYLTVMVRIG